MQLDSFRDLIPEFGLSFKYVCCHGQRMKLGQFWCIQVSLPQNFSKSYCNITSNFFFCLWDKIMTINPKPNPITQEIMYSAHTLPTSNNAL